jgi:hypothetical protein
VRLLRLLTAVARVLSVALVNARLVSTIRASVVIAVVSSVPPAVSCAIRTTAVTVVDVTTIILSRPNVDAKATAQTVTLIANTKTQNFSTVVDAVWV